MDSEQLILLKDFISLIKGKPNILHTPELSFFKNWLLSLGAKIPIPPNESQPKSNVKSESQADSGADDSTSESEIEFGDVEIVPEDNEAHQEMGDDTIEPTEEMLSKANDIRSEAQAKFSDGDYVSAAALFTEAIKLNPLSALLYARRASCYVKLKQCCAAMRDCDKAIEINPDSATPYKWRGLANKMLGRFEQAYNDLQLSLKLDYSDDAYEAMKEVEPMHKKIFEHNLKYHRKREDKLDRQRQERLRKARESREKAKQEESTHEPSMSTDSAGDAFSQLFSDPDLMSAIKDPEIMKAFSEVASNPAAMHKYENNPKVKSVLEKLQNKFGGMGSGGMPGNMPFGMDSDCKMPSHTPDLD